MNEPLAERVRPKTLDDYISQKHLVGETGALTSQIKKGVTALKLIGWYFYSFQTPWKCRVLYLHYLRSPVHWLLSSQEMM